MIYGYLNKTGNEVETEVKFVETLVGTRQTQFHFISENTRLLNKDVELYRCECEVCSSRFEMKPHLVTHKIRKNGKLICNECGLNLRHLTDEKKQERIKASKLKELETKKRNGTTPRDLIDKGMKWGFSDMDQTKGSDIRKKMNKTKEENNTFGHNGTETRSKMEESKKQNGTTAKEVAIKWRNDKETLKNAIEKQIRTKLERGLMIPDSLKTEIAIYRDAVYRETNKQDIKSLINFEKRGKIDKNPDAYHLDHKYSISEGFKNKIAPEIIGSIHNLEFIPAKENCTKQERCSITLEELFALTGHKHTSLSSFK